MSSVKRDVESGERTLYPTMLESPELRWSFIRKVYFIITFQLLLTIAVASVVVFFHPVANFFTNSKLGYALYIVLLFVPFIRTYSVLHNLVLVPFIRNTLIYYLFYFAVSCPLYAYHNQHPLNYFLLLIFTVALAFPIGLTSSFVSGT